MPRLRPETRISPRELRCSVVRAVIRDNERERVASMGENAIDRLFHNLAAIVGDDPDAEPKPHGLRPRHVWRVRQPGTAVRADSGRLEPSWGTARLGGVA